MVTPDAVGGVVGVSSIRAAWERLQDSPHPGGMGNGAENESKPALGRYKSKQFCFKAQVGDSGRKWRHSRPSFGCGGACSSTTTSKEDDTSVVAAPEAAQIVAESL